MVRPTTKSKNRVQESVIEKSKESKRKQKKQKNEENDLLLLHLHRNSPKIFNSRDPDEKLGKRKLGCRSKIRVRKLYLSFGFNSEACLLQYFLPSLQRRFKQNSSSEPSPVSFNLSIFQPQVSQVFSSRVSFPVLGTECVYPHRFSTAPGNVYL